MILMIILSRMRMMMMMVSLQMMLLKILLLKIRAVVLQVEWINIVPAVTVR